MKKKNEIYSLIGLLFIVGGMVSILVITYLNSYCGVKGTVFLWILSFFSICIIISGVGIIALLATDGKFTVEFMIKQKDKSDEKEIPTK